MLSWLIFTTLEVSLLIGVVLVARPLIRRAFGAIVACDLWLVPAIGVLLPTRPPRPGTLLDTISLPGAEVSRNLYAAAGTWEAPSVLPWEALWLAGAAVWAAMQLARSIRFRRTLAATAAPFAASSPELIELLDRHGFRGRVFTTTLAGAPFVTGLIKPKIFLPADFAQRFSAQEQQWVMVHELTHLKRGDLWARLVAEGLRTVFWFNPFVHLAVRSLRQDQEYACDQAVVSRCSSQERYRYGKALMLGTGAQPLPSFVTFFRNNKERYAMLGKYRESRVNSIVGAIVCLMIGVLSLTSAPRSIAQSASVTLQRAEIHMVRFEGSEAIMKVVAADQTGQMQEWTVVLGDPRELMASGFPARSFAPGAGYLITGDRSLNPSDHRLVATSITRPDGSVWRR